MDAVDLIVAALSVWEIVELWHHGSIFATWRAKIQARRDWFARLVSCPFCLTPWVAGCVILLMLLSTIHWLFQAPLYVLAAARLANVGNDLTYAWCRTPKNQVPIDIDLKSTFEIHEEAVVVDDPMLPSEIQP